MKMQRYADDGYVYEDEIKIKKYFLYKPGWNHYWEPATRNIIKLESLYHRLLKRTNRFNDKITELIAEIYEKAPLYEDVIDKDSKDYKKYYSKEKVVHAKPDHNKKGDKIWLYQIAPNKYFNNRLAYSYDWVDCSEEAMVYPELGNKLYYLDYHSRPKFVYSIKEILEERLHDYIRKECEPPLVTCLSRTYSIKINNRTYWFMASWKNSHWLDVETLHWPESDTFFKEIK